MNTIYVKSGKIGLIWLYGFFFAIVITPLISFLYGMSLSYFSDSLGELIVKIIIFCVFACLFGIVQTETSQLSKCRNNIAKIFFFISTTALSFYLSWVFYVFYITHGSFNINEILELILNPIEFFESFISILMISTGWMKFYWITELIGFAIIPFISIRTIKELVFCEDCNKWTKEQDFKLHLTYENLEQLKEIAEKNINELLNMPIAKNLNQNHIIVNFHSCDNCMVTNTLNFDLVTYTKRNDDISKLEEDYSPVICISNSQLEAFKNKAAITKKSNLKLLSKNKDLLKEEIENGEPVKTTIIETVFYSRFWKLVIGISSTLLILSCIIEPFLGFNSTIKTCESINFEVESDAENNETSYYYRINLAKEKKESFNLPLLVPEEVGKKIETGDKITIYYTKWRKFFNKVKLKNGLIYTVYNPYEYFIFIPITLLFTYLVLLPSNKPPKENDKNQKNERISHFIMNILTIFLVLVCLFVSLRNYF